MGRIAIPVSPLDRVGVAEPALIFSDVDHGHSVLNSASRMMLQIVSTDAGDQTVDFLLVASEVDGVAIPPKTITIPAGETISLGNWPKNYYDQPAAAASAVLISDTVNDNNNETVTIDTVTYVFKTSLSGGGNPNEVLIGVSAADSLANLAFAITADVGFPSSYGVGTVAHPTVTIGNRDATSLQVHARVPGDAGNDIPLNYSTAHLVWDSYIVASGNLFGGLQAHQHIHLNPSIDATLGFRAYSF